MISWGNWAESQAQHKSGFTSTGSGVLERFEKCSQSIRIRCNNQVTHAFVASIIVRHFEAIGEEFRLQEANGYRLEEDGTRIYPR
jgi:hypothetical protein